MKIQSTKRKFYNKWLYKVTLKIKGCVQFRAKQLWEIQKFSTNATLVDLANLLSEQDADKYAIRIERTSIDIYTNDKDFFNQVIKQFETHTEHCFAPVDGQEKLLDSHRTIIASKFPHAKYQYKVFLQPHKLSADDKIRWINWLDTQTDHLLISKSVKDWFIRTNWNWDRRYMYVENEQTLLMLKMKNSEAIGSVYSYVVVDK